jgi:hypothetical protein
VRSASDVDLIPETVTEQELLAAIEGRLPQIRPVEAFKELQQRKSPRIGPLLLRVLGDRKLAGDLRASAAVELGKEDRAENRQALARAIDLQDTETLKHVARSLGQIGDESSLRALEAVEISPGHPAWRSLSFARALIAYRYRLDSHTLEPIPAGQVLEFNCQKPLPVKTRIIEPKELKEMLPSLQRLLPAIPISEAGAIHLDCQGVEYLLVFNREMFKGVKAAPDLGRRKGVPGALLMKSAGLGAYFVHEYLLTNPQEKGKSPLFGVRSTGISLHSGEVTYSPEGAEFHFAALNTSHAPPLDLTGRYDLKSGRVSIERAVTCAERAPLQRKPRTPRKDDLGVV